MKSVIFNKDISYSLSNSENYKKELDCEISEVTKKYSDLLIVYFKFILENIKISNEKLKTFIVLRGLDTITNVFLHLLYYTKNCNLTYFHCQKSFYFYVEFVGQISDDEKSFLQLSSRDATTYVYKKTIFDIKNEFKNLNEESIKTFREKMKIIESYIFIYQTYLLKVINLDNKFNVSNLEHFYEITEKINHNQHKSKINNLENIIDKLYSKIDNFELFFTINNLLIKKFIKNQKILSNIEKKINLEEEFNDKLKESPDKFINWLISN